MGPLKCVPDSRIGLRYFKTVEVDAQVFKNIRLFKADNKAEGDALFDRVNVSRCPSLPVAGRLNRTPPLDKRFE